MAISEEHQARHDSYVSNVTLCKSTFEGIIKKTASKDIQNIQTLLEKSELNIKQVRLLKQSVINIQTVITANELIANNEFELIEKKITTHIKNLIVHAKSYRTYGWFWRCVSMIPYMKSRWETSGYKIDTFINNHSKHLEIDFLNFQTNVPSAKNNLRTILTLLDKIILIGNVTAQDIESLNHNINLFNSVLSLQNSF